MTNQDEPRRFTKRSHLLATVSVLALLTTGISEGPAAASDASNPAVWIEIGLHSDQVKDSNKGFALPFGDLVQQAGAAGSFFGFMNLSRSNGEDGRISFRPDDTDWVFSATVRYGRAQGKGHFHQSEALTTNPFLAFHTTIPTYPFPYHRTVYKPLRETASWVDADTVSAETHYTLDFEAGRDVGLGLFGRGSVSTFSAGVRFAQFTSALNVKNFDSQPDVHLSHFQYMHPTLAFFPSGVKTVPWYFSGNSEVWHDLAGNPHSSHNFVGIGPTISWDASAPLAGNPDSNGFSLDWSLNAALLFGKQKNNIHHKTVGPGECYGPRPVLNARCVAPPAYQNTSTARSTKNVTVPNLGGSIGISYRLRNMKVNVGYRADYFFRVLDTGLPGQGAITRGFAGPFASISVGLGD